MMITKLAYRNIMGRGLRTWLNVFVLSLAFVFIVWAYSFLGGWSDQAVNDTVDVEIGGGQFHHSAYDRFDPLTLEDAHAPLSEELTALISDGKATPVLMTSGAIFPEGRAQSALIKGVDPSQKIVSLPSHVLESDDPDIIPGLIGDRMARGTKLKVGDYVTVRWRDAHGTFDAADITISGTMKTNVPSVDLGQIWIPLEKLREMLDMPGEATLVTMSKETGDLPADHGAWVHRDLDFLLSDFYAMLSAKYIGQAPVFVILLAMGLLAIFDTQVLAVFRRRKEIGTLMAMGMVRRKVIGLFTLEGSFHGVLALIAGGIYGTPLFIWSAKVGWSMPEEMMDQTGMTIATTLYPTFGLKLLLGTVILAMISVTIVSFLPTRRIAKLKPTDALRGKMS